MRSKGLLRRLAGRWYLGVALAVAGGLAAPVVQVAVGTARARACIASYEAPRGPELPDCRAEISWFVTPSRLPWTASSAQYRAEEIAMRQAVAAYADAAVGRPDAGDLGRAAGGLVEAAKTLHAGSRRIALEELGRAVGAPDLGRSAMLLGDRRTLLARADAWEDWNVRQRALEAALLEGDLTRATAVAQRYAEWDPHDEDLRVAVAAVLCLGDGARRGLAMLATVEDDRARHRHESWARNWGDVRALIEACADVGGIEAPRPPDHVEAGTADLPEVRMAQRLRRLARARGESPALRGAGYAAISMLKGGRLPPGARVRLLAALLAAGHGMDPSLAANLARPRVDDGEDPIAIPVASCSALDWLDEAHGTKPAVPGEVLRDAAAKLWSMARSAEIGDADRRAIEAAAAAAETDAVRVFAQAADARDALQLLDDEGGRISPAARALGRSSAWYLAAEPARALAEIERDPEGLTDDPALRVVFLIQRAELLASNGRRGDAARAAAEADQAAAALGDRGLALRARWTRVAFEPPSSDPEPRPGATRWPWVGSMALDGDWLTGAAESDATLEQALSFWAAARRASPEDRRAVRYAAVEQHRGEAPRALSAYLLLAGELLAPGEGDVEVWLDAFSATSGHGVGLRAYAWARAEAARFRGDAAAAARWTERYRALVKVASRPDAAEIAAALGL